MSILQEKVVTMEGALSDVASEQNVTVDKDGITVIRCKDQRPYISESDAEMDTRAVEAVKAAISKAKICKKPVAKYDRETKRAYIEYPDGEIKYVE